MNSLGKIYGDPLVSRLGASSNKALESIQLAVLQKVRDKLVQSAFSERARKSLARSLKVKISSSQLTIYSEHPAFGCLMREQRGGQMTWLTKARAPIPIITETGKLIFRTASIKSMKEGKWIHPGRSAHGFIEQAKMEVMKEISKAMTKEIFRTAKEAVEKA